jgi:type II secretory pathway predicted ATPase ExeA
MCEMRNQEEQMNQRLINITGWMTLLRRIREQQHSSSIAVLLGPPGSGKTTLVQDWQQSLQQKSVAEEITYIAAKEKETSAQFCRRVLSELHQTPMSSATWELMEQLGAHLHTASIDLFIVDQAELCSLALLRCLRSYLFDKWGVSLLLVGQLKLEKTIERDESLSSRVGSRQLIEQLDQEQEPFTRLAALG